MNHHRALFSFSATWASAIVLFVVLQLICQSTVPVNVNAFTFPSQYEHKILPSSSSSSSFQQRPIVSTVPSFTSTSTSLFESSSSGYFPPEKSPSLQPKSKIPEPKVGDVVRYYDLDGGKADGQELVGKITFIQSTSSPKSSSGSDSGATTTTKQWLAEVTEMEDVGDGYYTEYPSRKRRKSKFYPMTSLSPLIASYVRTEDAYKIPTDSQTGRPLPSYESYDLENYGGPASAIVNADVVQEDLRLYTDLKWELIKGASIAGLFGTVVASLVAGLDDALIYAAGAVAGVGYLFFLGVKTDTVGSDDAKLGSNVSNLRFVLPLIVLIGVSLGNLSSGGGDLDLGAFRTMSSDQFAAAMLGFLTYRIPLFASQLGPLLGESAGMILPGSAGVAMQMANEAKSNAAGAKKGSTFGADGLTTVLLISGPAGTGKSELVERLIEESDGKLVPPKRVDIVAEPMLYEQLVARGEILQVDDTGRYALATDGILSAARKPGIEEDDVGQVVVVDADVRFCKKLVTIGGTRLVGVWIGLDKLEKFESNLKDELDSGAIPIPEDETKDSVLRAKIREIVKDIEYGVVSGIFEFTVLNDDFDKSLLQLKNAADYCFE